MSDHDGGTKSGSEGARVKQVGLGQMVHRLGLGLRLANEKIQVQTLANGVWTRLQVLDKKMYITLK